MTLKLTKNNAFLLRGKIEGFYNSKVSYFGNGGKIDCSKSFIGREVIVFVLKPEETL